MEAKSSGAPDGEPTGLLKDNAMALVDKVAPPPSPEMRRRALAAAMRYVAERGVTTVHDMSTSAAWSDQALYVELRKANGCRPASTAWCRWRSGNACATSWHAGNSAAPMAAATTGCGSAA